MSFCLRAGRCDIQVGFSCFVLLAFVCLFMGPGALWALLAITLHEGGHLLALKSFGAAPRQLRLSAMGLRLMLPAGAGLSGGRGAVVSLAGPAANLASFLFCLLIGHPNGPFAQSSLALGLLHLLPIEPLDGGLALRGLLSLIMPPRRAEAVSRWASGLLVLPLGALGFWLLLRTRYNYSLLALAVYLMLYLVLGEDYSC